MKKYDEGDVVQVVGTTADGTQIPVGANGKVIMIHPKNYYEVMFRGPDNKVIAVSTIAGHNLRLVEALKHMA